MISYAVTPAATRMRALSTMCSSERRGTSLSMLPRTAAFIPVNAARLVDVVPTPGHDTADAKQGSPPRGEPR